MKNIILCLLIISSIKTFAQIQILDSVSESLKKMYFEERHDYNPLHVGDLLAIL